jgi:hypothetical protein
VADVNKLCRTLRLIEYFDGVENTDVSLVSASTQWEPDKGRHANLDTAINYLKTKPAPEITQKPKYNVKMNERQAIDSLKQNNNIIIKEADKGAAIVIIHYKRQMETLLQKSEGYEIINKNMDNNIIYKIKKLTEEFKEKLTKKEITFLTSFEHKTSNLYGLPKVHKCLSIIEEIKKDKNNLQSSTVLHLKNPEDLTFRPIVAGPACPTNKLSELLNILLLPYVKYVKSYVRDDIDILNKLPLKLDKNEKLLTFDVEALYNNIRHDLGLEALKYFITQYPDVIDRIPGEFIVKGAELILKNNTFMFNDVNYIQTVGTAMGTKFAPNYATLTLGYLEIKLYNQLNDHYSSFIANKFINSYFRFLDDGFIIFDPNVICADNLLNMFNSLDATLNLKKKMEGDYVNFLDVTVSINVDHTLTTDIYYKSTDTKQYLNYNSCHPRHTKNSLPYNLARRICTIVSNRNIRDSRLKELEQSLTKRNYPINIIKTGFHKALNIDQKVLRNKIDVPKQQVLPYITKQNPNIKSDFNDINYIINYLKETQTLKNTYKNVKVISSKRQAPNLKNMLCRAAFTSNTNKCVSKCNKTKCKLCDIIIVGNLFYFKNINWNFTINFNMSCETLNCIYVIVCKGCEEIYIGETSNLRLRVNLHRDHIIKDQGLAISRHIHTCASNLKDKFHVMPFFKMNKDDTLQRRLKEKYFINKCEPNLNVLR